MNRNTVVNIGIQRFDKLREQGAFYIDKTDFIREWWEKGSDVTLITRPRRGDLFEGLSIWEKNASNVSYERFYHGFVPGLMVELSGRFQISSNRESGFGRCDVMMIPADRERDCAYIIEFKVHKPQKERDLTQTVANALTQNAFTQIEEKQYTAELTAKGFEPGQIRRYGFAFRGKECLIG